MTERVRARQKKRVPHTSEDVMAFEPDVDFSTAGGHFPRVYLPSENVKNSDDDEEYNDEDYAHLIPDPVSFTNQRTVFTNRFP